MIAETFTMKGVGQVVVLVALLTVTIAEAACGVEQEEVFLELNVGTQPNQVGYALTCNDLGEVWTVPIGSLSIEPEFWLAETACVSPIDTCFLDLTLGESNEETFFVFAKEATTIGFSENDTDASSIFCFGPNCEELPLEIEDMQDGDDDADIASIERGKRSNQTSSNPTNQSLLIAGIVFGLLVVCLCIIIVIITTRRYKRSEEAFVEKLAANSEKDSDTTCSEDAAFQ